MARREYLSDGSYVLMRFWTRAGAERFCARMLALAATQSLNDRVVVVRVGRLRRYAMVSRLPFYLPDWVEKAGYWR